LQIAFELLQSLQRANTFHAFKRSNLDQTYTITLNIIKQYGAAKANDGNLELPRYSERIVADLNA